MRRLLLFLSLLCFSCVFAQSPIKIKIKQIDPDSEVQIRYNLPYDTLYIEKTETYTTETYRLIHYLEGESEVLYTLTTEDGSSIDYLFSYNHGAKVYDCFSNYNNATDGNSFLFFDKINKELYITYGCYADYYPIPESVDFERQTALLENKWSGAKNPTDTLYTGHSTQFIGYEKNIKIIAVEFKKYE